MYARIQFVVNPAAHERYSWIIDTARESVDHWRHAHPEAEELVVTPLEDATRSPRAPTTIACRC